MSTGDWLELVAALGFLIGYATARLRPAVTECVRTLRQYGLSSRAGKKSTIHFAVKREGWPSQ